MIFSILAFLTLIISITIKERNKSLIVQSLNCLFEALYCFVISAYTGSILSIINLCRTFPFILKEKFNKLSYLIVLIFFESVIIINCIITWEGYISFLPTIGSAIRTYCLWQSKMKYVRISGIITGLTYGLYYLYHGAWFMVFGNILVLIAGIVSLIKNKKYE